MMGNDVHPTDLGCNQRHFKSPPSRWVASAARWTVPLTGLFLAFSPCRPGQTWEWLPFRLLPSFAGASVRSLSMLFLSRRGYNPGRGSPLSPAGGEDFMSRKYFPLSPG